MKTHILFLMLLGTLSIAATFDIDSSFKAVGQTFTAELRNDDSLRLISNSYRVNLYEGLCQKQGVYEFCLEDLDGNQATVEITKICKQCYMFTEGENLTLEGVKYVPSIGTAGSGLILNSEYGTVLIGTGDCTVHDIFLMCVRNIEDDVARYYPDRYNVVMNINVSCPGCAAFGRSCTEDIDCSMQCVNDVCRPEDPWCGDAVCDQGEPDTCLEDCPVPEMNETNSTTPATDNETGNASATPTQQQEPDQTTPSTEQTPQPEPLGSENKEAAAQGLVQESVSRQTPRASSSQGVNWIGVGVTVLLGAGALIYVFKRKKKPPIDSDEPEISDLKL